MWKTSYLLRQHWRSHWGLSAGVATGLLLMAAQWLSPHVGEECGRLGQVAEEWRIGLPAQHVICVATLDGDLVYDRLAVPHKQTRQSASLLQ
jgi:hypothetical protein